MYGDSLRERFRIKLSLIELFLRNEAGIAKIALSEDFDRDGVLILPAEKSGFRLFVSHEFLSDFSDPEIEKRLQAWKIATKLKNLPKDSTLFITTDGTFIEEARVPAIETRSGVPRNLLQTTEQSGSSPNTKALYDRVFSIRVDGEQLGTMPIELRDDGELTSVFSDRFASILGTVYLLDAAGFRDFSLQTLRNNRDADFVLRLSDGAIVYFDFKRVRDPREKREGDVREVINIALRRAMRDEPAFRDALLEC